MILPVYIDMAFEVLEQKVGPPPTLNQLGHHLAKQVRDDLFPRKSNLILSGKRVQLCF